MSELGEKYQLGERIGGGGMADVFRATTHGAEGFSRPVAIKQIKKSISRDKDFAKLFISEAQIAAQLIHNNIVQTIDFDRDSQGRFYLVMELIEGIDLRRLISSGRIPVAACVYIVSEVLRALDYAHELVDDGGRRVTIVHRDISPHNIMLGWQGVVKVVDFGIAKAIERSLVSRSGSLKGKVSYMSPEQVHGHGLDGRSDLFAAGIVLHEILTGQRLFVGQTEAATLSRLLTQPIPRPSSLNDQVPADLDTIVMCLLERDREHRFTRAKDAMDALTSCSVAIRGRNQLETILSERFSERVPRRVARLNSSASSTGFSDSYETPELSDSQQVSSEKEAFASAPTIESPPSSKADPSLQQISQAAATLENPKPIGEPKRTFTASPVAALAASKAEIAPAPPVQTKWILMVGVGIALAGAGLAFFLTRGNDTTTSKNQPIVVLKDTLDSGSTPAEVQFDSGHSRHNPTSPLSDTLLIDAGQQSDSATKPQELPPTIIDAGLEAPQTTEKKPSKPATLTIRVQPWATIVIDGKSYGQTPQTISLRHGRHSIVLQNSGIDKKESFSVTLKKGKHKIINKSWR